MRFLISHLRRHFIAIAALVLGVLASTASVAQNAALKTFSSPEEGVAALVAAAQGKDAQAFAAIFGPALKNWIISGDPVADQESLANFLAAYEKKHVIAKEGDAKATLSIGDDDFPFPFPLVKTG
ncbi:MAG: DUF2950 family protein, partial [Alphaproteobacteria bacterium]